MYKDFQDIGHDYIDVFYGGMDSRRKTALNMRHLLMIIAILDDIKGKVEKSIYEIKEYVKESNAISSELSGTIYKE